MPYLNMSCPVQSNPIDFSIGTYCQVANGAMIYVGQFYKNPGYVSGGGGNYEYSAQPYATQQQALNGAFFTPIEPVGYSPITNGTWYVAVRDKDNPANITVKSITTSC